MNLAGRLRIAALAGLLAPSLAPAAEWSLQSGAQLYALSESNPQLQFDGGRGAQAGVADLSMNLLRRTELLDLVLDAGGSLRRYDQQGLDRDDQQVSLSMARRGERHALRGSASVTRDTTLTSELGTTGISQYNQRHRARALSLSPQWLFSERLAASLTLGWQDSRYARGAERGLSDYQYTSASLANEYAVSELTSASLVVSTSRLDSARYAFNTHNLDAQLQLRHSWSSRWQGALAGGASRVESGDRSTRGSVFSASVTRAGERMTADLSLSRRNAPDGSGLLSRRDEAALRGSFALSETINASITGMMIRSRQLLPRFGFTVSDTRYLRGEMFLTWRMARDWSLGLGAGAAEQRLMGQGSGASGHNFDARLLLSWRRVSPVG